MLQLADVNSDADIVLVISIGLFVFLVALILSGIEFVAGMRDYGRNGGWPPN